MNHLSTIIRFLDDYHPTDPTSASAVTALKERARREPTPALLHQLADAVDSATFTLKRGTTRMLPGLARRIRQCAASVQC